MNIDCSACIHSEVEPCDEPCVGCFGESFESKQRGLPSPREAELEKEVTRLTQAAESMRERAVEVCSELYGVDPWDEFDKGFNAALFRAREAIRALKVGEG